MATRGRRLLPAFRPNTNVPELPPGRWTTIQSPTDLARIAVPEEDGGAFRSRVQSVPSPWARMLLFRDAMLDPEHPARTLVENELLDALELVWLSQPHGARLETEAVRVGPALAAARGASKRVEDYADALEDLAPRRADLPGEAAGAVPLVMLARVNGAVVFGSSPYTVLFTAEDAEVPAFAHLFRYATGGKARALHERAPDFQAYVATVVLPQLGAPVPAAGEHVDRSVLQRGVQAFLRAAVEQCRRRSPAPQELMEPTDPHAHARTLNLEPAGGHTFGGVTLYTGRQGTFHSRWLLHATRDGDAPLVLLPDHFDGVYGEGLPPVRLPADLRGLDRSVLPGTGFRRAWVYPQADWLADQLVVLSQPVNLERSQGYEGFVPDRNAKQAVFGRVQLALPLKGEFFRWFRPEDVASMLRVEVTGPGEVRVRLQVPVGPAGRPTQLPVERRYTAADIRMDVSGPELFVWPDFTAADWSDYALFRVDRQSGPRGPDALQVSAFRDGEPLRPSGLARRAETVQTYAFGAAPEVVQLSLVDGPGAAPTVLGVLLPRYHEAPLASAESWRVGVDFGTSNTVLAVHRDGQSSAELLTEHDLLLELLVPGADTPTLLDSYFLPDELEGRPFNTAVVHTALGGYDAAAEPLLLRVNIPFVGWVKDEGPNGRNRVSADLKWSSEQRDTFLAQAFLRTTTAVALASARKRGVAARNVRFSYAYPQAFEEDRIEQLGERWRLVLAHHGVGDGGPKLDAGMEESRAILRHCVESGLVATTGALSVVLDVGGGSTDIAIYGRSQAVVLDSLRWGGRDLTGARPRLGDGRRFSNPFVQSFAEWALEHGFPLSQRDPLEVYRVQGLDTMAFSYLVRSPWFEGVEGLNFQESGAAESFRALVLYFFSALYHYVGLLHRAVREDGVDEPVVAIVMGGNGSRFVQWLQRDWSPAARNAFRDVLSDVFARASRGEDGTLPRVSLSPVPKEEVARGLVAPRGGTGDVRSAGRAAGSVVGEQVRIERAGADPFTYDVPSRIRSFLPATESLIGGLRWAPGEMEIERFHASLVAAVQERLAQRGGPWQALPDRLESAFRDLGRTGIQQATHQALQAHMNASGGVPGSIFMVEAAAVLDRLMDAFLAGRA